MWGGTAGRHPHSRRCHGCVPLPHDVSQSGWRQPRPFARHSTSELSRTGGGRTPWQPRCRHRSPTLGGSSHRRHAAQVPESQPMAMGVSARTT